ncbi:phage antirepressor KilAC domain-containing protein [Paenibacillus sp. MER 78]|uniref:phage antirepressor KilAC domain-containing protein n=1 Tax=Paenibacillus sp. MER 78 TaxID=2939571 RepID=UPI00203BFB8D|nr:phage antirepressor KilAC domain-containing protein [Paenibacillus sp. MER 78]MCM3130931.1 phage antirepressor KilAC domain-containing protein [Paenibacillus sp. MER 78]
MQQLVLFEGHEVLILFPNDINFKFTGEFLIRAKDVATALEYRGQSSTNEVLKFCKEKHVYLVKNSDMANRHIRKLNNAGEKFISNFSLNRVLGQSEQPKAAPFQDWLYEDVLSSISNKGTYMTMDFIEQSLNNPDNIIKLLVTYKEEKLKRIEAELKLKEASPKISYYDIILKSKSLVTISQIAKDYGLTGNKLNEILKEKKIQFKQGDQWLLYSKYADKGYTQSETHRYVHKDGTDDVKMHTKWTQRGRIFIHELLTSLGIKPNIEKEYPDVK